MSKPIEGLELIEALRERMHREELSLRDVAKATGLAFSTVGKWLRNEGPPSKTSTLVIKHFLGLATDTELRENVLSRASLMEVGVRLSRIEGLLERVLACLDEKEAERWRDR